MANKGKSRSRNARRNLVKAHYRQQVTQARQQRPGKAGHYDKAAYDGTDRAEEES